MRLNFNENTKEVCINDGASNVFKMQKISAGLVILSQVFLLIDIDLQNITLLDYLSMTLITLCLGNFYYSFFKSSYKNNILVKDMLGMKHKNNITGNTFSFKLKNGKTRTLTDTTSRSSETILPFCKSHNIPIL